VLWVDSYNTKFFNLLRNYSDQVIIEVYGHDHFADLRYHSSQNVATLVDTPVKYDFHNMLVAPGSTPYDGSNPGVAHFEIDETTLVPSNLKLEFININNTLGKSSVTYADLDFYSVDFSKDWGVKTLDATSLADFRKVLEPNEALTLNYLVSKLGFDYTDSVQMALGISVLTDIDVVTSKAHHTGEYICLMHKSVTPAEY
jgi:hypothetical protein